MLRRPPTPGVALQIAAPQQRAFWSQAVAILSRLANGTSASSDADTDADAADKEAPGAGPKVPPPRTSKRTSAWRPRAPADAAFPEFLQFPRSSQLIHAKKTFSGLARLLRRSPNPEQLLQSWDLVRQCRPFIVGEDGVRLASGGDVGTAGVKTKAPGALQMLPADVFAQRTAGTNGRAMFIGSTVAEGARGDVTAANEAVVVALLVECFHALGDHFTCIDFFEGYRRDRRQWLKSRSVAGTEADTVAPALAGDRALSTSSDGEEQKKLAEFARSTRLWAPARSAYLKSLLATNRYRMIVKFAWEDRRNLETACESVNTMSALLIGCRKEKDSALARLAIETMSKKNPVCVLPLMFYELAFKAAIHKKNRDEGDLDNALWIASAMKDDAGYVLHPDLWFALFNTSLHRQREDSALEIFSMYSSNFTSTFQEHFRRALRKACRLNHPDVVLAMVRQWLAAVGGDATGLDAESKTKVLGFVLSEMLSSNHPVPVITEMLAIMESSQTKVGGPVLQRVVQRVLDDDGGSLSPHDAVKNSLDFWRKHRSVVQNSVYLVYVMLQQCLGRGWLDECELVVNEIVEHHLSGVPCNSVVKVLDANEKRGQFESNVRMCEMLLKSLSRPGFKSLNQQFFERYLKALLCIGRFDEVREQHVRLKLGQRFPKSAPIAVALCDAQAQQV